MSSNIHKLYFISTKSTKKFVDAGEFQYQTQYKEEGEEEEEEGEEEMENPLEEEVVFMHPDLKDNPTSSSNRYMYIFLIF